MIDIAAFFDNTTIALVNGKDIGKIKARASIMFQLRQDAFIYYEPDQAKAVGEALIGLAQLARIADHGRLAVKVSE